MNIGQILSSAFSDSFRNRSLWITGLVCMLIQLLTFVIAFGIFMVAIAASVGVETQELSSGRNIPAAQLLAVVFSTVFVLAAYYFSVAATQAVLIDAVYQNDTQGTISIARALRTGLLRGAPMFAAAFVAFLPLIALLVVFAGALLSTGISGTLTEDQMSSFAGVLWIATLCVALPLTAPALGILVFAERDLVINNHGPITALSVGWHKLRKHILDALLFGVMFYFLQSFLSFFASFALYGVFFSGVAAIAISGNTASPSGNADASSMWIALGVAGLCITIVVTVIGLVVAAWYNNLYALIWTRAFLQSESKTPVPTVAQPV